LEDISFADIGLHYCQKATSLPESYLAGFWPSESATLKLLGSARVVKPQETWLCANIVQL